MERLIKLGEIKPVNSANVAGSPMGLGMEKLDRDAFDPEKVYDKVACLGVKWIRLQSGWQKTENGLYAFKNLPVKDYPLIITFDEIKEFKNA